jgi:hypothetical protein
MPDVEDFVLLIHCYDKKGRTTETLFYVTSTEQGIRTIQVWSTDLFHHPYVLLYDRVSFTSAESKKLTWQMYPPWKGSASSRERTKGSMCLSFLYWGWIGAYGFRVAAVLANLPLKVDAMLLKLYFNLLVIVNMQLSAKYSAHFKYENAN